MKKTNHCFVLLMLILLPFLSFSQVSDSIRNMKPVYFHLNDIPNSIGVKLSAGVGFDNFKSGIITDTGDDVMISAGGGISAGIIANTPLTDKWVLGNEINFHIAELLTPLQNATGMFTHFSYMPAIKYSLLFNNKIMALLPYAGPVIAFSGKYDLDATKLTNGHRFIANYKASTGYSIGCEFMVWPKKRRIGGVAGIRFTSLSYSIKEGSLDGAKITREELEKDLERDMLEPRGDAIDMTVGIIYLL